MPAKKPRVNIIVEPSLSNTKIKDLTPNSEFRIPDRLLTQGNEARS